VSSSLKTPAIHFKDLEFIIDRSSNLSPSPEGSNFDVVVRGTIRNGTGGATTPQLHQGHPKHGHGSVTPDFYAKTKYSSYA
jgi:hypothetical protein